jgi:5'-nucleotidase
LRWLSRLRGFANLWAAAPSDQKTGAGQSLMGDRTKLFSTTRIRIDADTKTAFHGEATPALVVRHAFSGINYVENIGYAIGNSGTVEAALECAVRAVPAIAVSIQTEVTGRRAYEEIDLTAAQFFLGESRRSSSKEVRVARLRRPEAGRAHRRR